MSVRRLSVRLTPRSSRDQIDGWIADPKFPGQQVLGVHVRAAPVDGAANAALLKMLSKALRIPQSNLRLTAGSKSRIKTIEVLGVSGDITANFD